VIRGARRKRGREPAARLQGQRRFSPTAWGTRHVQVLLSTLGRLSRSPIATLMTAAVIGIAVALPAGLHLVVKNVQSLSGAWEGSASISLFLRTEVSAQAAEDLATRLRQRPLIEAIQLISREQALAEFRALSGFGEALDLLAENPLPSLLLVQPAPRASEPAAAEALLEQLRAEPEVELAQLDLQWVRRLHAFTAAAQRGIAVLGAVLAAGVLLIIGNTIRLEIQNRQAEIEISRLVGATNAFIRRPFLYTGLWYGLLGGAIAWLLITVGLWLLHGPMERLAGLYQSEFDVLSQTPGILGILFLGSPLLGLAGAWLAVSRQLAHVEPD
jgi:cell division transport system permease protein